MIRTTVVGSWPLPEMYRERLLQYHRGVLPAMLIKPTLVGAAEAAIREQKATGVRLLKPQAEELKVYTDVAEYEIVDEINAPHGLGYVDGYRRESQIDPALEKVSVPGPLELLSHLRPREKARTQLPRAIEIVNREIRSLAALGAKEIQLDIPFITIRSILGSMTPEQATDLVTQCLAGVQTTKTIHCCLGDLGSQSAVTVHNLQALMPFVNQLGGVIDKVHLECSHPGQWADRTCLRDVPKDMEVIAGVVDVKGSVETTESIAEHVKELLRVVEPERLWIAPSCGFGRRTTEVAIGKLARMVEAAKRF